MIWTSSWGVRCRGSTNPPPALAFRVVDGELSFSTHFTAADGVTYALSTAPGSTSEAPGQAMAQRFIRLALEFPARSLSAGPTIACAGWRHHVAPDGGTTRRR